MLSGTGYSFLAGCRSFCEAIAITPPAGFNPVCGLFFCANDYKCMFKVIETTKIKPGKNIRVEFDNEIRELATSINKNGLLNPITVEKNDDGTYEVVAGHRRFQAMKSLNEPFIECNVLSESLNEKERLMLQLQENTCRKDMSAYEYVELFEALQGKGMTQKRIAELCGKSQAWVSLQYTAKKRLEELAENGELSADDKKLNYVKAIKKYKEKSPENERFLRFSHSLHNFRIQVYNTEAERELLEFITEWRKKWQN